MHGFLQILNLCSGIPFTSNSPCFTCGPAAPRLGARTRQESQPLEGKKLNPQAAGGRGWEDGLVTLKEENGTGAFRHHSTISVEGLSVPGSLLGTKARASSPSRPFWSEVRHKSTKLTNRQTYSPL